MVQEKNKVSVMVICYNQEKYIRKCLESILSQKTHFPFEIVVGDDASSDNSYEIIKDLKQKFPSIIKLINEKNHVGYVPNYMRTLKYCQGEFLAFCDGDDYWIDENKLEDQELFLLKNLDYGLVYSDYIQYNENTKTLIKNYLACNKFKSIEGFQPEKFVRGDNQIMSLTTCVRTSLLGADFFRIMNDKNLYITDFPTWLWIGLKSKVHFEPKMTAVYRVHKNSITNSHTKENAWIFHRSHLYIRKKILGFLNYVSPNWKLIDCQIQRELMLKSMKLKYKQVYGIASFRALRKYNAAKIKDYITVVGLYCPSLVWPVRILLSVMRRLNLTQVF